jgi:hypothetical protein
MIIHLLMQATTQPAPVQVSALTVLLGSIAAITWLSSFIVGKLTPVVVKVPLIADLPIGFKVVIVAILLGMIGRYCPGIHTLSGNPLEIVAEIILESLGGTLGLVHGAGNLMQTTRSVNTLNLKLAAAKQP